MLPAVQRKVEAFQTLFEEVENDPQAKGVTIIWSGAYGDNPEQPPILCDSEELAIKLWSETLQRFWVENGKGMSKLIWHTIPILWKYTMTMEDMKHTQRLTTARYSMYSAIKFEPGTPASSESPPMVEAADQPKAQEPIDERTAATTGTGPSAVDGRGAVPARRKAKSE